jgi:hypothetical protein
MKSIFRTTVATATAVMAVMAGTATPATAAVPAGSIAGTLTTATGAPLADTFVSIESSPFASGEHRAYSTRTDATGHYRYQRVVPGPYIVSFVVPGTPLTQYTHHQFWPLDADVHEVAPARTTTVDDAAVPTGTITGRFTDAAGNGLDPTWISAHDRATHASGYARADASGRFSMQVFTGTYRIGFTDGVRTQYAHQQVTEELGTAFPVAAGATVVVDETAMGTGSIAGRLLDADGTPAVSARVEVSGATSWQYATTTTAADGTYRIDGLLPDAFRVSFFSADSTRWQMAYHTIDSAQATNIPVASGRTSTVDDTFLPTGALTVTVTDATAGSPIPNACVHLEHERIVRSLCSDGTGRVTLNGVPRGSAYSVFVSDDAQRYLGQNHEGVAVAEGQTTNLAVALTRAATIETTVRDAGTGQPVGGICVWALTLRDAAIVDGGGHCSDDDGKVTFSALAAGTYTLLAKPTDGVHGAQWVGAAGGTGDQYRAQQVTVQAGQTATAPTIDLDPAGSITGTVTDATTGAPAQAVCVSAMPVDAIWSRIGYCPGAETDAGGNFTVTDLGPYAWPVEYAGSDPGRTGVGYAWQWSGGAVNRKHAAPVTVTAGKATNASAALSPGATVRGTVVDAAGAPMTQATVSVINSETGDAAGASSVDEPGTGSHLVHVLPQTVKITYGGGQRRWYQNATDADHATDVVVTADGVTLTLSMFPVCPARRPPRPPPPPRGGGGGGAPPPPPRAVTVHRGQSAAASTACRRSGPSTTGLPRVLLAAAALATISSASAARTPRPASPGTPSSSTVVRIHSTPSATDASASPVSSRAAVRYLASALSPASPASPARSAATFASTTAASSAAQTAPCGAAVRPPLTPAKPCTAPSLALARAIPPSSPHSAMSVRAARSVPSAYAVRSPVAARRNPSAAHRSVNGLAIGDTSGSRHWVSASSPLAAVTAGGQPTVSSGSTRATAGSIGRPRMLTLIRCSGTASTAFAVTSEPVPAVVGTATQGAVGPVTGRPAPTTSRWSDGSPPVPSRAATALPRSRTLPPPMATTTSAPSSLAVAVAATASATVGSPATVTTVDGRPTGSSSARYRRGSDPVQISALVPRPATISGSSLALPGPNTTRPAVAKSNGGTGMAVSRPSGLPRPGRPG